MALEIVWGIFQLIFFLFCLVVGIWVLLNVLIWKRLFGKKFSGRRVRQTRKAAHR